MANKSLKNYLTFLVIPTGMANIKTNDKKKMMARPWRRRNIYTMHTACTLSTFSTGNPVKYKLSHGKGTLNISLLGELSNAMASSLRRKMHTDFMHHHILL